MEENIDGKFCKAFNQYEVIINGVKYAIWWDKNRRFGDDSYMCYWDEDGELIYDIGEMSF